MVFRLIKGFIWVLLSGLLMGNLVACGLRGPLTLPQDPAAANRATLPQTWLPDSWRTAPQKAPPSPPSPPPPLPPPTSPTSPTPTPI